MARKKAAKPRKAAASISTKKTQKKSTDSGSAPRRSRSASAVEVKLSHDAIAQRAYEIWLEEGQPHGRADTHWTQARDELLQR